MRNRFRVTTFLFFITLAAAAQSGMWVWMKGDHAVNSTGHFSAVGVADPQNTPPALYEAGDWTDQQGRFWIFGGSNFNRDESDQLWMFDPATNVWTLMNGGGWNVNGVYGVQGVPSPTNHPGSRAWGIFTWVDQQGNLWMYGGYGYDAVGTDHVLNDLWKYDIVTGEWTWMNGGGNTATYYGTKGVASAQNHPPAKNEGNATWVDNNGDLWMFGGEEDGGGYFYDSDMWKYSIGTNEWTWMSGSNQFNTGGYFGTVGVTSPLNDPGPFSVYAKWKDQSGNFWMYGGINAQVWLSGMMWKFDPNTLLWTWMAGGNNNGGAPVFSLPCQNLSNGERPGGMFENRACWTDKCGRFWNYGGFDFDSDLSFLWMFDPGTNNFFWINGSPLTSDPTFYGNFQTPTPGATPGALGGQNGFIDNDGNFWLFGGMQAASGNRSNALWKFMLDPNCTNGPVTSFFYATDSSGCAPLTTHFEIYFQFNQLGNSYHWDFGDPSTAADTSNSWMGNWTYTTPGTYTVTLTTTATGMCGPPQSTSSIVITVGQQPNVNLGNDTLVCNTTPLLLNAGNPGAIYQWSTGAQTQTIEASGTGNFWVNASYGECKSSDTIYVDHLNFSDLGPDQKICPGARVKFTVPDDRATVLWNDIASGSSFETANEGLVWAEITYGNCIVRDTVSITIDSAGFIFIPNVFTPNDDGTDDYFAIGNLPAGMEIDIFDRWGNLVFVSNDPGFRWDGKYNGTKCPDGVYYYTLNYPACIDGEKEKRNSGFVHLVR